MEITMERELRDYVNLPWTRAIEPCEDGGYFCEVKELPGCMTVGEDKEDAEEMLTDALTAWLEVALARGIDIPEPRKVKYNEV
jgi:antitoxin HicB